MKISSTQRLDNEDVCAVWLELDNNSYKYLVSGQSSVQTNFSLLVRMLCRLLPAVLLVTNLVIQTALGQDDLSSLEEAIPGVPGEDFPIFGELPSTSFLCDGRLPGYYADPEVRIPWGGREAARLRGCLPTDVTVKADCQMFHMCVDEEQLTPPLTDYPFLCPNGTLFRRLYKVESLEIFF